MRLLNRVGDVRTEAAESVAALHSSGGPTTRPRIAFVRAEGRRAMTGSEVGAFTVALVDGGDHMHRGLFVREVINILRWR